MVHEIDYLGALRRNWILLLIVVAVALALTAIVTARQSPIYESSAQLVVAPTSATIDPADVVRALETLERRTVVATFARMAATEEIRTAVTARLRIAPERARRYRTSGSVVPSTNIIRIDSRGPDAAEAAAIANGTAEVTARQAEALYRVYALRFLARATPPREPVYPDRRRNFLVGGIVALFAGVAAALTRERFR